MSIMTNPSVEKEPPNLFPIRLTAVAGLAAAAILFVNAAKRTQPCVLPPKELK